MEPAAGSDAVHNKPIRADLAEQLFRALYPQYQLSTVGGMHVVVPRGTPCFVGPSLGAIARQISEHSQHSGPP